jgi:hypothetical protein
MKEYEVGDIVYICDGSDSLEYLGDKKYIHQYGINLVDEPFKIIGKGKFPTDFVHHSLEWEHIKEIMQPTGKEDLNDIVVIGLETHRIIYTKAEFCDVKPKPNREDDLLYNTFMRAIA